MVSLSPETGRGVPVGHTKGRLAAAMPPGSGPRKGAVLAEKPQLQVKTTETGHVACHLLLLT